MTFCHTLQTCAQAPAHAGQQRPLQHHPVPHLSLGAHLLAAGLEQLCAGGGLLLRQADTWVSGSEAVPCGDGHRARPKIQLDQYVVMGQKQLSRGEDKSKTSGYETLRILNYCHCVPGAAQREREASWGNSAR